MSQPEYVMPQPKSDIVHHVSGGNAKYPAAVVSRGNMELDLMVFSRGGVRLYSGVRHKDDPQRERLDQDVPRGYWVESPYTPTPSVADVVYDALSRQIEPAKPAPKTVKPKPA